MRLIDIGGNLLDSMYQGIYNDKSYHAPDLEAVLERGWGSGEGSSVLHATMKKNHLSVSLVMLTGLSCRGVKSDSLMLSMTACHACIHWVSGRAWVIPPSKLPPFTGDFMGDFTGN